MVLLYLGFAKLPLSDSNQENPKSSQIEASYIVTQSYGGQMTRAIRNLMVQQCWAGFFQGRVLITEPFSIESTLVHTPQIWNDLGKGQLHYAARFSDYYNLSFYNEKSVNRGSAQLVTWETFLNNAPRVAVVINIPTQSCNGVVKSKCFYSKAYQTFIDALTDMGFDIVTRICLTCSAPYYKLKDFTDLLISNSSNGPVSIFVNSWRNFGLIRTWMEIPDYCKLAENPESSSSFLTPSALVIHHSSRYINNFIQKKHFVGIMLRIERFLTMAASGRSNDGIQSCLSKIMEIFDEMVSLRNVAAYVTVDIGKYGSGVMQKKGAVSRFGKGSLGFITSVVELLFKHVYNATVTLENWEATFINATGGISERGYIAMIQRNIASQADCLILMGGGSFLQVAGFQYLSNKKNTKSTCLHTVCVPTSFNKALGIYRKGAK